MNAEKEREYWLHENGYSGWKPAYYGLTEEQRGWLMVGNVDAQAELCRVLEALPGERLLPWCEAYAADFGSLAATTADEAHASAFDLAGFLIADAQEIGAAGFERRFPIKPAELDAQVLDMLRVWAREEDLEFYE